MAAVLAEWLLLCESDRFTDPANKCGFRPIDIAIEPQQPGQHDPGKICAHMRTKYEIYDTQDTTAAPINYPLRMSTLDPRTRCIRTSAAELTARPPNVKNEDKSVLKRGVIKETTSAQIKEHRWLEE
ncbi:hypothetical protein CBL_11023 [Carabus blaptoides fortunei]